MITIFYEPRRHATTEWCFGPPDNMTDNGMVLWAA
jgi:hypothetical protein